MEAHRESVHTMRRAHARQSRPKAKGIPPRNQNKNGRNQRKEGWKQKIEKRINQERAKRRWERRGSERERPWIGTDKRGATYSADPARSSFRVTEGNVPAIDESSERNEWWPTPRLLQHAEAEQRIGAIVVQTAARHGPARWAVRCHDRQHVAWNAENEHEFRKVESKLSWWVVEEKIGWCKLSCKWTGQSRHNRCTDRWSCGYCCNRWCYTKYGGGYTRYG